MDFLTFKDFISIPVLIGFYYLGAVVMPIFMWLISFWLGRKFTVISNIRHAGKEKIWQSFSIKQEILFIRNTEKTYISWINSFGFDIFSRLGKLFSGYFQ
jgi:hypothetical protein